MGIYDGEIAKDDIKDYVNHSDAILNIGAKLTDSATAGFSYQFDINDVVMINHRLFKLNDTSDTEIALPEFLEALSTIDYTNKHSFPSYQQPKSIDYELTDDTLTQDIYFKMMQDFIGGNDVLIAEQGSSFFGAYSLALPKNMSFIGQPLWGSIGYTPATLGAQLANPPS